jgi:hypothetical protein
MAMPEHTTKSGRNNNFRRNIYKGKAIPSQAGDCYYQKGTSVVGTDDELETPLIDDKDCAYVIYDGKTALCGIEQAYNQGVIDWKNLFPVIYILFV